MMTLFDRIDAIPDLAFLAWAAVGMLALGAFCGAVVLARWFVRKVAVFRRERRRRRARKRLALQMREYVEELRALMDIGD